MSLYAPIIQGLRDINTTITANRQERRQLENSLFEQSMKRLELEAMASDPRRKFEILKVQEQMNPQGILLPTSGPEKGTRLDMDEREFYSKELESAIGYKGPVYRDDSGYAVDENGELITDYGFRAKETTSALHMKHFSKFGPKSGAPEQQAIREIDNKIYNIEKGGAHGTTQLKQNGELHRLKAQRKELQSKLQNPVVRAERLRAQKDYIMYSMNQLQAAGFRPEHVQWATNKLRSIDTELGDIQSQQLALLKAKTGGGKQTFTTAKYYDNLRDDIKDSLIKLNLLKIKQKGDKIQEDIIANARAQSSSSEAADQITEMLQLEDVGPSIAAIESNLAARMNQIKRYPELMQMAVEDGLITPEGQPTTTDVLGLSDINPAIAEQLKPNLNKLDNQTLDFFKNYTGK